MFASNDDDDDDEGRINKNEKLIEISSCLFVSMLSDFKTAPFSRVCVCVSVCVCSVLPSYLLICFPKKFNKLSDFDAKIFAILSRHLKHRPPLN